MAATLATTTSTHAAPPGVSLTDSIVATGFNVAPTVVFAQVRASAQRPSAAAPGPSGPPVVPLTWTLLGPVAPAAGSCAGSAWIKAPSLATGTITIKGSGTYATGPVTPATTAGCYSFVDTWTASANVPAGHTTPGDPTETTLVGPTLVTTASASTVVVGGTLTDSITATGFGTGASAAPIVATWSLLGPVAPVAGSCAAALWTGAPTFATGAVTITGAGTYTTAAGPPIDVSGCYTYTEATPAGGTVPADHNATWCGV